MSTCYLCTAHGASQDPESVLCCSTCGIFTCVWDGARLHGKGASECAICMVRVLVESADLSRPPGDPGGGGIAAAEAHVREYLATTEFENECKELAQISQGYRGAWRGLLRMQLPSNIAREFGLRLAGLAGGQAGLAEKVEAGIVAEAMDSDLLADAAGVGEYARRLSVAGPQTLASVAQAESERAKRELDTKIAAESATPAKAYKTEREEETKEELKVKYMGA